MMIMMEGQIVARSVEEDKVSEGATVCSDQNQVLRPGTLILA
jgi:hypothetical protein